MSILIPTNNDIESREGATPPSPFDVAQLATLAGEFFASLPSGGQNPSLTPQVLPHNENTASVERLNTPTPTQAHPNLSIPVLDADVPSLPVSTLRQGHGIAQPSDSIRVIPTATPIHFTQNDHTSPTNSSADSGTNSPFYFLEYAYVPHQGQLGHLSNEVDVTSVCANSWDLPYERKLPNTVETLTHEYQRNIATSEPFYFVGADHPTGIDSTSIGTTTLYGAPTAFDVHLIRRDFPILSERVNGKPLIWFDNAATTHKPLSVIDRISYFYKHENSNIHRAAHELAARATDAYENAREKVRTFINAKSTNEIVFVRGATEAINLVAKSWGTQYLRAGDEIVVSHLEHHANIVPWQQLAKENNLKIKVIPVDDHGQLLLDAYAKLLTPKVKLVALTQVSNALGTVTPAQQMIAMAHAIGAKVLIDGAQSVSHMRTDVQKLDADWFVLSGHKMFGPTGIGVLYGKEALLNDTQPWQGGGNMIEDVTFEHTRYHSAPMRFEAGTGNIADAVGLGAAVDYINRIGIETINAYEHWLLEYGTEHLKRINGVRIVGTAHEKTSVLSFVLNGYTTTEVGQALSKEGIAVRSGHHCAQPILRRMGLESTVRPSFAFYNTCEEIDLLVDIVKRLAK